MVSQEPCSRTFVFSRSPTERCVLFCSFSSRSPLFSYTSLLFCSFLASRCPESLPKRTRAEYEAKVKSSFSLPRAMCFAFRRTASIVSHNVATNHIHSSKLVMNTAGNAFVSRLGKYARESMFCFFFFHLFLIFLPPRFSPSGYVYNITLNYTLLTERIV